MTIRKKTKKIHKGIKASAAFFAANILVKGIAYLSTPVYTHLLNPYEYGYVSVFFTWVQIFGIVAMFCLAYEVFNNGMLDYPDKRDEYSFSMLILSNIITLCFSAVIILAYPHIKNIIGLELPFIVLMCVFFLTQPAYNFWIARQRYEYKYKTTVFWTVTSVILTTAVSIAAIMLTKGSKLYARIFGSELTFIIIYAGFYIYLAYKSKFRINTKYWKEAFLFNLPLIPHYLSSYMLNSSDKIMISRLAGESATAYYSVAYSIAAIAMIIWYAINPSLVPYTYEKCRENDYASISKVTMPILAIFAFLGIGVTLLAPEAVYFISTKDYMEAIYIIPPVVGSVFFQVQYSIYANIVYYYKKPTYVMVASVTATVLNILLNYIFIKKFGYIAAGFTTLVCYGIQAVIDFFAMRKITGENVYNMRYIILLSAFVVAFSLFGGIIYKFTILRYIILMALVILSVIFRKKIFETLKFSERTNPNESIDT